MSRQPPGDAQLTDSDTQPQGWTIRRLNEVSELNPRHPLGLDEAQMVTFLPMPALSETEPDFDRKIERPLKDVRKGFTHFADGDVLFAKITPCMENGKGAVASRLKNGIGCGTTELHVVRPSAGLDPHYVYRFLQQDSVRQSAAANFAGSAGQLRVPLSFLAELEIPLPPLAEQRRIVAKLESVLGKVSTCQQRLSRIPALLKRFRQSVLAAACSGKLTADWRAENNQSIVNWGQGSLKEIATELHQGINTAAEKVEYTASGYKILQAKHITSGRFEDSDARFVSKRDFEKYKDRYNPKKGNVLFTNIGTIGKSLVVQADRDFLIAWNIFLIEFGSRILPEFARYHFEVLRESGYFGELNRGNATQFVNKKQLSEISFALPTLCEQQEIVRRVEKLFALADQIEARLKQAQAHVDRLTQSILAKAFRGELVPTEAELARREGRDYESAEALLQRIKSTQPTTSKEPTKRKRKAKS